MTAKSVVRKTMVGIEYAFCILCCILLVAVLVSWVVAFIRDPTAGGVVVGFLFGVWLLYEAFRRLWDWANSEESLDTDGTGW